MKKIILFLIFGIVSITVGVYVLRPSSNLKKSKKITIVTTLYPIYDITRHIGKEMVDVTLLLPPGVEAHAYEPPPKDIVLINQADIFIFTSNYMEPWVNDMLAGVNRNMLVVDASKGIDLLQKETSGTSYIDPHYWLDFDNTITATRTIMSALIQKDPGNQKIYEENAKAVIDELTELDRSYRDSLNNCQKKEIIYAGHYAFGYLSRKYGLISLAAQGMSPDSEPTVQDIWALIQQIQKNSIGFVFYEELASPKIAEMLKAETGAQLLLLNAAHNISKDQYQHVSFFSIMRDNLKNLTRGLVCN